MSSRAQESKKLMDRYEKQQTVFIIHPLFFRCEQKWNGNAIVEPIRETKYGVSQIFPQVCYIKTKVYCRYDNLKIPVHIIVYRQHIFCLLRIYFQIPQYTSVYSMHTLDIYGMYFRSVALFMSIMQLGGYLGRGQVRTGPPFYSGMRTSHCEALSKSRNNVNFSVLIFCLSEDRLR